MKPYRICFLGGLQFENGHHPTTRFRTQKTATLLAYLALHRGPQPREVLADLLWPDDAPEAARHSLRMALSSLRRQLEISSSGQANQPLFEVTRFAIGLRKETVSTDVADFEEALKSARHAQSDDERARHYASASELYRGPFLPGFYDDWCLETAARLETAAQTAEKFLSAWRLKNGHSLQDNRTQLKAMPLQATRLVTLLIFDGAALTRARAKRLQSGGGSATTSARDGLQVWIFPSASAALESAITLRHQARRIAIYTGEITGHDASKLERRALGLLEIASPEQFVCCEATALLERARTDIECHDLGFVSPSGALSGATSEQVFAISWASETVPPIAPSKAVRPRVPRPLDEFFGRADEFAQLRTKLREHRLVTLLGAGGAGKTRVALQLAAALETERTAPFGGAIYWVALSDVARADGIARAICDALGVECLDHISTLESAIAALHQAPATLLVLDNFEHLVEDGAAVIEELLERATNARCLVTSRRLLDARGEAEVALAPLRVPAHNAVPLEALRADSSVQLFCNRARAVRPDFALTAHNAADVAALCRHLEGMPLALELAAARVGQMVPARILERLQTHATGENSAFEQFDWLHNRAHTTPPRHRSLRATVSWSVNELNDDLQTLLARLSVFRGSYCAQEVAGICQAAEASEKLDELRARSLIVRAYDEDEARYSMLETVRQYAHELAQQRGETENLRCQHATYFLGWAQNEAPIAVATDAPARVQSWRRVRARADNLREALVWARHNEPPMALQIILACHDFSGAHLSRAELDIATALSAVEGEPIADEIMASALKLAAIQAAHRGDIAAQNEFALRHLDLIRNAPDASPETLAWAYFNWGSARHRSGHVSIARAALQQSLELFAQLPAPYCHQCRGWTLIEMGNNAFDAGDFGMAFTDFEQCDLAFTVSGDRDGQASAKAQLADVCFHAGDHARAAQLWPQVSAIMDELGDEREHEWRRYQEGKHTTAQGDLERGHELLRRALRAFANDGQKLGMLRSLLALSYYWLQRDQPARAARLLQAERAERRLLGWPIDGSWHPQRQEMWSRAHIYANDSEAPTLEIVIAQELAL